MREVVKIPVIMPQIIRYMNDALMSHGESVRASTMVPNPRPSRFLKVLHLSSNRLSVAHAETNVLFECWAEDDIKADELGSTAYALAVAAALESGAYVPEGASGTVAAPYPLADPDTRLPRSVFTIRFIVPMERI